MESIFFVGKQMTNIIVFYWEPGSCGDFVNRLLMERPLEYEGVLDNLVLTDQGRFAPRLRNFFTENFISKAKQWYLRNWTVSDCDLLLDFVRKMKCKRFVIPTHSIDQVFF